MQSDVDTILIHTKLGPIFEHLQSSETELRTIQNSIIQSARNKIMAGDYDSKFVKALVGIVRGNMETISALKFRLSKVTQPASSVKSKRALEILGDFLSGITGVPSASDHRKTLEQIKMLELDRRSIMNLMKESNHKQKDVISATHENELVKFHANSELNSKHIISIKNSAIKVLTALSMTAKVMETLVHTNASIMKSESCREHHYTKPCQSTKQTCHHY